MKHLVVFGDSIAAGFWDREGGWVARLRDRLVGDVLEDECETYESERYVELYNLSVSGDSSTEIRDRFEREVEPRQPTDGETVVLFAFGSNDAYYFREGERHNTALEQFRANIQSLIEMADRNADRTLFVGLTPVDEPRVDPVPWHPAVSYRQEHVRRFDRALQEACNGDGVPFIDPLAATEEETFRQSMLEDGVHPNMEGHEAIFRSVRTALVEEGVIDG